MTKITLIRKCEVKFFPLRGYRLSCKTSLKSLIKGLAAPVLLTISVSSHAVFTTPGNFEVSSGGSAKYSIPIQVPPGTAGLQPSLSLDYDSQDGNGILGMGWGLAGLSQISQCAMTAKLCLDGQVLISVKYTDSNNQEYRTDPNTFSKVLSYGPSTYPSAFNGITSFKVWTKGGLVMEYGNTDDSRIEDRGKATARLWGVNKISDSVGNYLTISYTENNANGEAYVSRIDYTGNAAAGLAPYASIRFEYEGRPDVNTGGLGPGLTRRLTNIRTYLGEVLVKNYRLTYGQDYVSKRSHLTSLMECDGLGKCKKTTTFSWNTVSAGNTAGISPKQVLSGDWKTNFDAYVADFNGDGFSDLYLIGKSESYFCAGPGITNSNNCIKTLTGDWRTPYAVRIGDFDGDGDDDLYLFGTSASYFCSGPGIAASNNCKQTFTGDYKQYATGTGAALLTSDFDGNGVTDLLAIPYGSTASTLRCLGPGVSTANNCTSVGSGGWALSTIPVVGNFSGSKKPGLFFLGGGILVSGGWSQYCSTPLQCRDVFKWIGLNTSYAPVPGDYNGDGATDLYLIGSSNSMFCAGPGITEQNNCIQTVSANWLSDYDVYPGDYNGDGVTDLYLIGASASYFCAGPGIASSNNCVQTVSGNWRNGFEIVTGDFNGDSTTDLYFIGSSASYFAPGGSGVPDKLIQVKDGFGVTNTVTYKPLTDSSVYAKDKDSNAATYPIQDVQSPLYVVSSATFRDQDSGTTITTNYSYGGAKSDVSLDGRGFLGFRWMKSLSSDTGVTITTFNRQDYPYIGLPSKVEKRTYSDDTLLSSISNTYAYSGYPYFPYVSKSDDFIYELDGALITRTTTRYSYDSYGNITQMIVDTNDGNVKTTTNTYQNDVTNWYLGRLLRSSVTATSP